MDTWKLKALIDAPPCREDMAETVLALAEGRILDGESRERIFMHLADCDSCRYLFEDARMLDEPGDSLGEECPMPGIGITIHGGILMASQQEYLSAGARAQVLASGGAEVLDFRVPAAGGEFDLRVVGTGTSATVEVRAHDESARYYLVGPRGYSVTRVYDGIAVFERVGPGSYVLSRDLKDFMRFSIDL